MAPHQSYFDEYPSGTGKIITIDIKKARKHETMTYKVRQI